MPFRLALLAWWCLAAFAQESPEHIGMLGVKRDPTTWISPESVVGDLRSGDSAVRLKAIRLVGANEKLYGNAVPDEIDLRYTTFGVSRKIVAVVTVEQSSFQFAAFAIPSSGTWTRIAVFECWCKYETPLDDFVHVAPAFSGDKLETEPQFMVRASGGGTGYYEQTEAWFRLGDGSLRRVLSFPSRKRSCPPSGEVCDYERRWFDGNQLIEGKNPSLKSPVDGAGMFRDQLLGWEASDSTFASFTCTPYKWDAASFKYVRSGAAHACKYTPPR